MLRKYGFKVMGRIETTPPLFHLNLRYDGLTPAALLAGLSSCHAVASKTSKLTWMGHKFHQTLFYLLSNFLVASCDYKKIKRKICNALHFSWNCLIYQFSTQLAFPARKMGKGGGRRGTEPMNMHCGTCLCHILLVRHFISLLHT